MNKLTPEQLAAIREQIAYVNRNGITIGTNYATDLLDHIKALEAENGVKQAVALIRSAIQFQQAKLDKTVVPALRDQIHARIDGLQFALSTLIDNVPGAGEPTCVLCNDAGVVATFQGLIPCKCRIEDGATKLARAGKTLAESGVNGKDFGAIAARIFKR